MNHYDNLYHHGIKGQKWGVRRFQKKDGSLTSAGKKRYDDNDIVLDKGSEIHRIVMKDWHEKEKNYSGHAYASYKKEDVEHYKKISRLFGDGNNYVDMTFKAKDVMVSPSRQKRVDEFVKLMDSNPDFKNAMIKATRGPLTFVPKKNFDNLDNAKKLDKAYRKFAFMLVSNRDLRDPYFKSLEKQGYSMIVDDGDSMNGLSDSPIIVFDRKKSMSLESSHVLGRKDSDRKRID